MIYPSARPLDIETPQNTPSLILSHPLHHKTKPSVMTNTSPYPPSSAHYRVAAHGGEWQPVGKYYLESSPVPSTEPESL